MFGFLVYQAVHATVTQLYFHEKSIALKIQESPVNEDEAKQKVIHVH